MQAPPPPQEQRLEVVVRPLMAEKVAAGERLNGKDRCVDVCTFTSLIHLARKRRSWHMASKKGSFIYMILRENDMERYGMGME